MNSFDFAHKFTSKWEGGYVNHPKDPGGATNFGVSLRWLKDEGIDINGDGKIDINDIHTLTPDKATELFKNEFWNRLKCDQLPKLVATVTYDAAINVGRGQAIKFLQRACNKVKENSLVVDGLIGPNTIKVVNQFVNSNIDDFVLAVTCITYRDKFYNQLVDNSPYSDGRDYRPFIKGWLNRTTDLNNYIR